MLWMAKQIASLQDTVKQQKIAEEKARLKKIQQELEFEKRRKEEEECKKREGEENRKKKLDMETRGEAEEEQKWIREFGQKIAAAIQAQLEKNVMEENRFRELLEQERRDHEMAVRLAQELNGQVEDSPPPVRNGLDVQVPSTYNNRLIRSEQVCNQEAAMVDKEYDLSKWKYSELRDAINTSCDIELLEACRHEFHRRLKVYHAWKARNRRRTTMNENEETPRSTMEIAGGTSIEQPIVESSQRYFRIPFVRPAPSNQQDNSHVSGKKGWWYAHFDGQYVARQMELHPDKPPILLLAGVDDMQMCELSLEETGLTRGAEILDHEFNHEWERHGGKTYISPCDPKK